MFKRLNFRRKPPAEQAAAAPQDAQSQPAQSQPPGSMPRPTPPASEAGSGAGPTQQQQGAQHMPVQHGPAGQPNQQPGAQPMPQPLPGHPGQAQPQPGQPGQPQQAGPPGQPAYLGQFHSGTPVPTTAGAMTTTSPLEGKAGPGPGYYQAVLQPVAAVPVMVQSDYPRSPQQNQEILGGNWVFLEFVPYFVATALQDTHLQLGLIIATAIAGAVLLLGGLLTAMNLRKVYPHILEVLMVIIYAVLLGVSYESDKTEAEIIRTYNFIVHSTLGGACVLSMLATYPVGLQYTQELVHRLYMNHPDVRAASYWTTGVLTFALVSADLLYLIPICKDKDTDHWSPYNLIFRLIYPPVAVFIGLLFVRYLPEAYMPNLALVHGVEDFPPPDKANPLTYLVDLRHVKTPRIVDSAMYTSTVEAMQREREKQQITSQPHRYGAYQVGKDYQNNNAFAGPYGRSTVASGAGARRFGSAGGAGQMQVGQMQVGSMQVAAFYPPSRSAGGAVPPVAKEYGYADWDPYYAGNPHVPMGVPQPGQMPPMSYNPYYSTQEGRYGGGPMLPPVSPHATIQGYGVPLAPPYGQRTYGGMYGPGGSAGRLMAGYTPPSRKRVSPNEYYPPPLPAANPSALRGYGSAGGAPGAGQYGVGMPLDAMARPGMAAGQPLQVGQLQVANMSVQPGQQQQQQQQLPPPLPPPQQQQYGSTMMTLQAQPQTPRYGLRPGGGYGIQAEVHASPSAPPQGSSPILPPPPPGYSQQVLRPALRASGGGFGLGAEVDAAQQQQQQPLRPALRNSNYGLGAEVDALAPGAGPPPLRPPSRAAGGYGLDADVNRGGAANNDQFGLAAEAAPDPLLPARTPRYSPAGPSPDPARPPDFLFNAGPGGGGGGGRPPSHGGFAGSGAGSLPPPGRRFG